MNVWHSMTLPSRPNVGRRVIAHCPKWCGEGYQVCSWDGNKFIYDGQPNDMFDAYVVAWSVFMEAD